MYSWAIWNKIKTSWLGFDRGLRRMDLLDREDSGLTPLSYQFFDFVPSWSITISDMEISAVGFKWKEIGFDFLSWFVFSETVLNVHCSFNQLTAKIIFHLYTLTQVQSGGTEHVKREWGTCFWSSCADEVSERGLRLQLQGGTYQEIVNLFSFVQMLLFWMGWFDFKTL